MGYYRDLTANAPEYVFDFTGGRLCLDFANSVSDRPSGRPSEHLKAYGDLVSWGRQAGVLTEEEVRRLSKEAARRPTDAAAALSRAVVLRETLYRIFAALVAGEAPAAGDLGTLNSAVAEALSHLRVVPKDGGFDWGWAGTEADLDRILWPVLRSAAELLTSSERDAVKTCASESCLWLFVDTSRNRSRRWCEMKTCGNRAKARRHYRRSRGAPA